MDNQNNATICICGSKVIDLKKHLLTKKHKKFIEDNILNQHEEQISQLQHQIFELNERLDEMVEKNNEINEYNNYIEEKLNTYDKAKSSLINLKVKKYNTCHQCSICDESIMKKEQIFDIECGHIFHIKCLIIWLLSKGSCPNCRNKIF